MEKPRPNWELISHMLLDTYVSYRDTFFQSSLSFKEPKNAVPGNVLIARIGADVKSGVCDIGNKKGWGLCNISEAANYAGCNFSCIMLESEYIELEYSGISAFSQD